MSIFSKIFTRHSPSTTDHEDEVIRNAASELFTELHKTTTCRIINFLIANALSCRKCPVMALPIANTSNRYRCIGCGNQFAAASHHLDRKWDIFFPTSIFPEIDQYTNIDYYFKKSICDSVLNRSLKVLAAANPYYLHYNSQYDEQKVKSRCKAACESKNDAWSVFWSCYDNALKDYTNKQC